MKWGEDGLKNTQEPFKYLKTIYRKKYGAVVIIMYVLFKLILEAFCPNDEVTVFT
jgi:hypothetical protein